MSNVTSFTALHDAIADQLKKGIPALRTVDALQDDPPSDKVLTPAVFVGVEEMATAKKVTGGRVAMTCSLVAYCLLSDKTKRVEAEILNMAASVASVVNGSRWGLGECVEPPQRLSVVPATLSKGGQGLTCWAVQWDQVVHLGAVWSPPDLVNDAEDLEGIYLKGCHDDLHRLEDFPNVDS